MMSPRYEGRLIFPFLHLDVGRARAWRTVPPCGPTFNDWAGRPPKVSTTAICSSTRKVCRGCCLGWNSAKLFSAQSAALQEEGPLPSATLAEQRLEAGRASAGRRTRRRIVAQRVFSTPRHGGLVRVVKAPCLDRFGPPGFGRPLLVPMILLARGQIARFRAHH